MALSYSNKMMLAPMVRGGTLPTRLLALKYGAHVVYGEELIDYRMLDCERIVNPVLDTIDFVSKQDHSVAFRTCAAEKAAVVFQMGTSDPDRAVQVAKLVEEDVAGIDVNMGCPKPFSIKGGMGAALLKEPELATAIMAALVKACKKPVTCKIRVLPTLEDTMSLAKRLEATGIKALGIHGRVTTQRPREPVSEYQHGIIKAVAKELTIPVIANGGSLDFTSYADLDKFKERCGASSVMVARAAQANMSIFRQQGPLEQLEVTKEYLKLAIRYDNSLANTKYNLTKGLTARGHAALCKSIHDASSMQDVAALFDLADLVTEHQENTQQLAEKHDFALRKTMDQEDEVAGTVLAHLAKRDTNDNADNADHADDDGQPAPKAAKPDMVVLDIEYKRKYGKPVPPKSKLHEYCNIHRLSPPKCVSTEANKRFYAVCNWLGEQYSTKHACKSRKDAEHAACLVALVARGLAHPRSDDEGYEYVDFKSGASA
eukprot:TRINITY_DN12123_c1_g2_i4.p1 TRINITY_DN12123_c1_g2~~TRINITY_DN12123_c1_g2_i4.p1  ORF type:complete len:535 (+),score=140.00 TRINITY_DN12123_c1_g2_i4:145-1605(+)